MARGVQDGGEGATFLFSVLLEIGLSNINITYFHINQNNSKQISFVKIKVTGIRIIHPYLSMSLSNVEG